MYKKMLSIVIVAFISVLSVSVWADDTGNPRKIVMFDSHAPGSKYVTLDGYTNSACDNDRILIDISDIEYRKEMFSMLLAAFMAGKKVQFIITAGGGQCRAERVYMHDNY